MTTTQASSTNTRTQLLTIEEVREHLRVSKWAVYQLINNRQLPTISIGRRRFVSASDLEQLLHELRDERGTRGW